MEFYIVGLINPNNYLEWQIIGLFDNLPKALKVCRSPNHFVGALTLNKDIGDRARKWKGSYYPKGEMNDSK